MTRRLQPILAAVTLTALLGVTGCARPVTGTATWPGARLDKTVLTQADFPPGVEYDRIDRDTGTGDGVGGPPAMMTRPAGCADGLTRVIAATADRGPGAAAEYLVAYDGARIMMTVLTFPLDLEQLAATAERCAHYETFFDPSSPGIPVTTSRLPTPRPDALVYEQAMRLGNITDRIYMSFENVGSMAVFGIAFPTANPSIPVRATLPETFLEVAGKQADRLATV
ncbi:hypothetical protein C731_1950 [Mycolicibacterium hassiacum DSM 44199]|jgi:hypothetical protein|uniref:Uncharacterized protein n=1 Tax=Mycolicibacterium hassiacum (strain DSM 44199 / CIP 105218 / JCM 12690 / 3849) TaxID=1122247 RepID=K5BK04_MYCHD|nr:hypothetical protein [Mycolicibacterium hassiacum]EKF24019.1 hypothetical protein C731_1950 [Mycolicibacterium hassiacum DSM 44199]MBX5485348.1 hypothetical protein [Mycolicibacterium hassiacum]MDA4086299.1 hypothetical protein [Mycolicibacterium hassiacum DSM 44199]VCT90786.1 hypothetical protein MHAS_02495 [Mycolicibacterium hassiacum DSM 44199]